MFIHMTRTVSCARIDHAIKKCPVLREVAAGGEVEWGWVSGAVS